MPFISGVGRKNHLFAGSDRGACRWATVASLVETTKLNNIEPCAYLADVLQRMVDGHPANRLDELMPWNCTPQNTVNSQPCASTGRLPSKYNLQPAHSLIISPQLTFIPL